MRPTPQRQGARFLLVLACALVAVSGQEEMKADTQKKTASVGKAVPSTEEAPPVVKGAPVVLEEGLPPIYGYNDHFVRPEGVVGAAAAGSLSVEEETSRRWMFILKAPPKSEEGIARVQEICSKLSEQGVPCIKTYSRLMVGFLVAIDTAADTQVLDDLVREYKDDLKHVERDGLVEADGRQTNHSGELPWGLDRIDSSSSVPLDTSFSYTKDGTGTHIYIFDTGINIDHEEFQFADGRPGSRATVDYDATLGTGLSHTGGWDDGGHGTHCAGSAAGLKYGVAKNASVHSVRVLGCCSRYTGRHTGTWSGIIDGVDWAVANRPEGPTIFSMSLGGSATPTITFDDVIQAAFDENIPVVVSAGNDGKDACLKSPARSPRAITVGATDRRDNLIVEGNDGWWWGSNFGSCVDILAPGGDILSADYNYTTNSSSVFNSGTSMSTPYVAGVMAQIMQANPDFTVTQAEALLKGTAIEGAISDPRGSPNLLLKSPYSDGSYICSKSTCGAECSAGTHEVITENCGEPYDCNCRDCNAYDCPCEWYDLWCNLNPTTCYRDTCCDQCNPGTTIKTCCEDTACENLNECGLCLNPIPASECPNNITNAFPNCAAVGYGELCEGDGECGTDSSLNNCGVWDMYRRPCESGQPCALTGAPTTTTAAPTTAVPTTAAPTTAPPTTAAPTPAGSNNTNADPYSLVGVGLCAGTYEAALWSEEEVPQTDLVECVRRCDDNVHCAGISWQLNETYAGCSEGVNALVQVFASQDADPIADRKKFRRRRHLLQNAPEEEEGGNEKDGVDATYLSHRRALLSHDEDLQDRTPFNLQFTQMFLVPDVEDGAVMGYAVCNFSSGHQQLPDYPSPAPAPPPPLSGGAESVTAAASVAGSGSGAATQLVLGDDDFKLVNLSHSFRFYNRVYDHVYVASNGYLTFNGTDTDYSESVFDHFSLPRVSALFDDLNPAAEQAAVYNETKGAGDERRAVFTYTNVPEYGTTNTNTFQITLYLTTGRIRLAWDHVDAKDGLVGLSNGTQPANFTPTDFLSAGELGSSTGSCVQMNHTVNATFVQDRRRHLLNDDDAEGEAEVRAVCFMKTNWTDPNNATEEYGSCDTSENTLDCGTASGVCNCPSATRRRRAWNIYKGGNVHNPDNYQVLSECYSPEANWGVITSCEPSTNVNSDPHPQSPPPPAYNEADKR